MDDSDETARLRAAAEVRLKTIQSAKTVSLDAADTQRLLHELQVHQIELEMQNEELQHTQAALEASLGRYKDFYDFSPVGYITLDQNAVVTEINLAAALMLGEGRNNILGKHLVRYIAQQDSDDWLRHFKQILKQGDKRQLCIELMSSGHLHVQIDAISILKRDGAPLVRIVLTDITARKQAEAGTRLAAVAFETQNGMLITDAHANILKVNQAFTQITGYSETEVIGKNPSIFRSGRHDSSFYMAMWKSINTSGAWSGEAWDRRKNGEVYPLHLSITAVKDQAGHVTNYVGTQTDMTEREHLLDELLITTENLKAANAQINAERVQLKERVLERTAQLQQANHAKDNFLATMSHEIRTPLAGLMGMMELLDITKLDNKQKELLATARESADNLLRILNDILEYSKIEAGKLKIEPAISTIPSLLKSVHDTYEPIARAKSISLISHCDNSLGEAHILDRLRIAQILNNMVSNALKFTARGTVEIRAELMSKYEDNETVRFSVKDSGIGMTSEQISRLFQQYEQASSNTARMYGGTGLGMAISHRLAESMGGSLRVESTPEVGSTFYFTVELPIAAQDERCAREQPISILDRYQSKLDMTPLLADFHRVNVLIVDDHPINRILIKQQLELLGVHVVVAESGTPALSMWQNSHFDLIITDCHMPEMDGYELTRQIRGIEQSTGKVRIPIIAWTANALAEESEHSRSAGMDDVLTKPTELSVLKETLIKWLN